MAVRSSERKRIVVLIDMDCFYVQVEQQLAPETRKLPCAVVQYNNASHGGSILAVDYTARDYGVSRGMSGNDASEKCPQIHLFKVPEKRGKADLTRYREVGAKVIQTLGQFCENIERASIDEAFLELTALPSVEPSAANLPRTKVAGWSSEHNGRVAEREDNSELSEWLEKEGRGEEKLLARAAVIVQQMRIAVAKETGCTCSAGIAHNKMLAKLAAGMNKPNGQTILPYSSVSSVLSAAPIKKIRYLGGKLGKELMEQLKISYLGELCCVSLTALQKQFGQKAGLWLHGLCRGKDEEPVRTRQLVQSLGCGKNFPGSLRLRTQTQVQHWLRVLASELVERLEADKLENRRCARQLSVQFQTNTSEHCISRSCSMPCYDSTRVAKAAWSAILDYCTQPNVELLQLSLSAWKFTDCSSRTLDSYLQHNKRTHSLVSCGEKELPPSKRQCINSLQGSAKSNHTDHSTDDESTEILMTAKEDEAGKEGTTLYPEEVLEKCSECGEQIPVWLMDCHKDHHLAVRLQNQELPSQSHNKGGQKQTLDCFLHKL